MNHKPSAYLRSNAEPHRHAGQIVLLKWVDEGRIPRRHRNAVRRHVDECARELGLPHVSIRWFREADDQRFLLAVDGPEAQPDHVANTVEAWKPDGSDADFYGRARGADQLFVGVAPDDLPNTIALHETLRGQYVAHVIAHECKHLAMRRDGLASSEADADAYGADYFRRSA